jgi:hypothetical protein
MLLSTNVRGIPAFKVRIGLFPLARQPDADMPAFHKELQAPGGHDFVFLQPQDISVEATGRFKIGYCQGESSDLPQLGKRGGGASQFRTACR